MYSIRQNSKGVASPIMIVLIVAVIAAVAGVGYYVYSKKGGSIADQAAQKIAEAECRKTEDKDICKFYASWQQNQKYRMVSTDESGGVTTKSTFTIDGDKTHIKIEGDQAYEIITIGDTTYTKAGDTWWYKKNDTSAEDYTGDIETDFDEPDDSAEEDKTTYKKIGKEACGNLTCFKYQVVSPDDEGKNFIWFDDKDYKLRKSRYEASDGTVSEQTYEYDNVSVSEPSPAKELGENQYIVPGSSEPVSIPSL